MSQTLRAYEPGLWSLSALAFKHADMTTDVLKETVLLMQRALPFDHRTMLVRVIAQWLRNIGPVLSSKAGSETATNILQVRYHYSCPYCL